MVSSDKDLLTLDEFRGIRILTPRQYLEENSPTETSEPPTSPTTPS